ncbi:hypothetical protein Kpho01_67950 [Kitasatospora phosalacinea]|uniref:Uncharacterized protein n=1 Tax=Kitasatospora phosalacinea TaxID=2065 RepID=A0A9W6URW4_9ACTN|nr:hypothetical protein Kpho01_67950 [Kitasatospora phosalacinea]
MWKLNSSTVTAMKGHHMTDNVASIEQRASENRPRPTEPQDCERTEVLRAHDAWALPVEVLLDLLNATVRKAEMPYDALGAMLGDPSSGLRIYVRPGLSDYEVSRLVRKLIGHYLGKPGTGMCTATPAFESDSEFKILSIPGKPADTADGAVVDAERRTVPDIASLYEGSDWAPMHGWCTDEEVIGALKALIVDHLHGLAEDLPEDASEWPEGIGATVAFGYKDGERCPLVFVDPNLPSGLRADLWGFCVALASGGDLGGAEPNEDGIFFVGTQRSPVTGPGVGLLAALTLQRVGRRPGDCGFQLGSEPAMSSEQLPDAA